MEQTPQPAPEPITPTGCCPPFDPAPWDEKEFVWNNKLFVHDHILSFFHMPLTLKSKVMKNGKLIIKAQADLPEYLTLIDENSKWGADIYIEVSKAVPRAKMVAMSGIFQTKVFEGPYKNIGIWANEMKHYVNSQTKIMKNLYYFYTTCPNCAKVYGKNYVVLFAEIER